MTSTAKVVTVVALLGASLSAFAPAQAEPAAVESCRELPGGLLGCTTPTGTHVTELSTLAARDGNIYVGLAASGGSSVLRSTDGGSSFHRTAPNGLTSAGMGWIVEDEETGRLIASSLESTPTCPVGDRVTYSDDQGDSWHLSPSLFCGTSDLGKSFVGKPRTDEDRAALQAAGYPNVIYHCAGGTGQTRTCFKSLDGANTFQSLGIILSSLDCKVEASVDPIPFFQGQAVVDPEGVIYAVTNLCGKASLIVSRDDGQTWDKTFIPDVQMRAYMNPLSGQHPGFDNNGGYGSRPQQPVRSIVGEAVSQAYLWQPLQLDSAGNLYLAYTDPADGRPYLKIRRSGQQAWGEKIELAPSEVGRATNVNISVRDNGHLAIAYYGLEDLTTTNYDGYLGEMTNALTTPHLTTLAVSPGAPLLPNGAAEPTEYTTADITPDGTVVGAFARDTCVINEASPLPQCDSELMYDSTRFVGVVATIRH
ncbi:hypothetical protein [Nocardia sp. NPDC005366]|uniref:hypothetical protein n=1 Tax=Nocardia sp. NPDC005366 TaxID=3156878 RepID=UPI0033B5BAE7